MNYNSIGYAKAACDTIMRKYRPEDLPPKGRFHYHQGVFLSGMYQTYVNTKEEKYFEYMKKWVDSIIDPEGNIKTYHSEQLDDMQSGILLFPLIEQTKDNRYIRALNTIMPQILNFPRTQSGGLWHMKTLPNQMWLDGLYMGGPICAEYGYRFGKKEYIDQAVKQIFLMVEGTRDEKTGLLYHAWDESRQASWADKETGHSAEFWGRAIGWVTVAILDILDFVEEQSEAYAEATEIFKELITAVCRYQSEAGLWYQVVDKGNQEENWVETSCSCLFTAAICKGIRKGILEDSFLENAKKAYDGIKDRLKWEENNILIDNVCIGTGVGNLQHYYERETVCNDLHGMGAFLLMCNEMARVEEIDFYG